MNIRTTSAWLALQQQKASPDWAQQHPQAPAPAAPSTSQDYGWA